MTELTKNDIFAAITDNPAVEPVGSDKFAYYLHYNADQDAFVPGSDGADITFIALAPMDYYGTPAEDETMDYWYRHESEDDPGFMAIVDDLYNQFMTYAGPEKKYYFPNPEYVDTIFGDQYPVCLDRAEVDRLSHEDGGWENIWEQVHEASAAEIEEFGVYDS